MLNIPRRYSHFLFGVIQSALTCLVAAAIASFPLVQDGAFLKHLVQSWAASWLVMLPVVLVAAPRIRGIVHRLTRD